MRCLHDLTLLTLTLSCQINATFARAGDSNPYAVAELRLLPLLDRCAITRHTCLLCGFLVLIPSLLQE